MVDLNCTNCGGMGWYLLKETDESTTALKRNCETCNPPLPPKPPRRKPQRGLRKQSDKTKAAQVEFGPLRRRWKLAIKLCEVCHRRAASDVHELVGGKSRGDSYENPRLWLGVCRPCHEELQSQPPECQLAAAVEATAKAMNKALGREAV